MQEIAPNREVPSPVTATTDSSLNRRTEHNIHVYSGQSVEAINKHIQELQNEWSIERAIEAGASVLAIIGIVLGAFVSPWCLILPGIICAFFLAHAATRFCPGLTLLQGKGTRTQFEIDTEEFAMKALRGNGASPPADKEQAALAERVVDATRTYSSRV